MAVEDIFVSGRRRATPNVGRVKTSLLDEPEVFRDHRLKDRRSKHTRFEVLDRVQVGNVDSAAIRCWAVVAVLIDIHGKQKDVNAIDALKQPNTFRVNWKIRWASSS